MFRILTVCTGNICRSVLAEGLLRRDLSPEVFQISSSGIMAVPNGAVPRRQLDIARKLGVHGLEEHTTHLITLDMVEANDLILAMSRGHRKRLMQLEPSSTRRTFTIREFARLAPLVTSEDVEALIEKTGSPLRAAVAAVAQKRGFLPPPKTGDELDVVDPYKQSRATYRLSRDQLLPAAQVTAEFLNSIVQIFGTKEQVVEPEVALPETAPTPVVEFPGVKFPSRASLHKRGSARKGPASVTGAIPRVPVGAGGSSSLDAAPDGSGHNVRRSRR